VGGSEPHPAHSVGAIDLPGLLQAAAVNLALALVACAGALRGLGGRVVGADDTETWPFLWGHFAVMDSVFSKHRLPVELELLDYPEGGFLFVKDAFMAILLAPVQRIAGLPIAFTVEQLCLFVLAGTGLFLLARELGIARLPALVAGVVFAFHPHMLGEAYNGNVEAMATGWMPLWLWAMVRVIRHPSLARGAGAAGLLFLLLFNNQYFGLAMALVSAPLAVVALWGRDGPSGWVRRVLVLGAVVLAGAAAFAPVGYLALHGFGGTGQLNQLDVRIPLEPPYLMDVVHLVRPFADLAGGSGRATVFQDLVYPGFLLFTLGMLSLFVTRAGRWRWCWAPLGLAFTVFSLGPALSVDGHLVGGPDDVVYLPWAYLNRVLPFLRFITLPHRLASVGALFLGLGLAWTLQGLHRSRRPGLRWLAPVLGVACLIEGIAYPGYAFPLTTTATPQASHAVLLGRLDAPGAVLNLPIFQHGNERRVYLWYQTLHRRPVDMSLRLDTAPTIAERVPLVSRLLELQRAGKANEVYTDGLSGALELGSEALREQGYGFVVLHAEQLCDGEMPSLGAWLTVLEPALGPGLILADRTMVWGLEPSTSTNLEQQARGVLPAVEVLGSGDAAGLDSLRCWRRDPSPQGGP